MEGYMKYVKSVNIVAIIMVVAMALGAFSSPVAAADSDPNKPGEMPTIKTQTVHDQTNEKTANDKTAFGGDVFNLGWYERPFDQDMNYLPFIDLQTILMNRQDPNWVYVKMSMVNAIEEGADSKPLFGLEMDTDIDNRGEFLITVTAPRGTEWSTDGVTVLSNSDNMIGGVKPVLADTNPYEGKGYDTEVFKSGEGDDPNLVFARMSPSDPKTLEIAFKHSFVGGAKGKYMWFPWAMVGMQDPTKMEFNDHFSRDEAGSPIKTEGKYYPVKAVWGVDNTGRVPSGFEPTGLMPGLIESLQPKPQ